MQVSSNNSTQSMFLSNNSGTMAERDNTKLNSCIDSAWLRKISKGKDVCESNIRLNIVVEIRKIWRVIQHIGHMEVVAEGSHAHRHKEVDSDHQLEWWIKLFD